MAENNVVTVEEFARAVMDYSEYQGANVGASVRVLEGMYFVYVHNQSSMYFTKNRNVEDLPESVKNILNKVQNINFNQREADDYTRIVNLFKSVYDTTDTVRKANGIRDLVLLLRKFKDQDLVYKLLSNAYYCTIGIDDQRGKYKDLSKQVYDILGSGENATVQDISDRVIYCETPDEVRDVMNGLFNKADKEITTEMSHDFPDKGKMQNVAGVVINAVNRLVNMVADGYTSDVKEYIGSDMEALKRFRQEVQEYKKQVAEKYDIEKVYNESNPLVIQRFNENLSVRISEVQARNERLEKENTNLVQVNDQLREKNKAEKEAHKAEKDSLEQQLTDEKAARQAAEALLRKAKELIDAFDKSEETIGKAGMFNKGAVKVQMKQKIDDARNALRRAEEEELKRKRELAQRTGQYEI